MPDFSVIHTSVFYELTALLTLASIIGFLGSLLRQPMIVSFIVVGVIAGPSVLGIVQSHDHIQLLAELGIALLLFLVGLKLDLKLIKTLGPVALATGLGQVIFTSVLGFLIALSLGLNSLTSIYVAVALTFSSTIIIVKLLSDKREVDSLHGRIAIGFLIVQDLVVVFAMMILSSLGLGNLESGEVAIFAHIATVIAYVVIALTFITVFTRYLAAPLAARAAQSQELLVVFAISWAVLLATFGSILGLSKELGGLLAGVSLASTPFREAIMSRLASLRDFLLLFFFIALGSQLNFDLFTEQIFAAIVLSVFVLIGNPVIVMAIMGGLGYRKRTSFLAGLTVAQISEFSLIFVSMGLTIGHLSPDSVVLVTLVGVITISLSVYMITYSHTLYQWLEGRLGLFERRRPYREESLEQFLETFKAYDVIIFGLGRYGKAIHHYLNKEGLRVLAVDFNPVEVRKWRAKGLHAMYGDASDAAFIASLPLKGVKWVISAIPQHEYGVTHEDPCRMLLDGLKQEKFEGNIAVSIHKVEDRRTVEEEGVTLVLLPFYDAAEQAVARIMGSMRDSTTA